jgi:RHS repeat-associated protein
MDLPKKEKVTHWLDSYVYPPKKKCCNVLFVRIHYTLITGIFGYYYTWSNSLKNIKLRKTLSFNLTPIMVLYIFMPCIVQAETLSYTAPAASKTLTYYCQRSKIMNTADTVGNMSLYLGRDVRSVIDTGGNISTNYLIKNGKDVIAKTQDGTKLSKTYQYTPYGKTVDLDHSNNHQPKIISQNLNISINPFRYSSYYLDSESGFYYLNTRYYSPELMRFISRDTYDLK